MTTLLSLYTITHGTTDYGDKYVVREGRVYPPISNNSKWPPEGFVVYDEPELAMVCQAEEPTAVCDTLEEARAAIACIGLGLVRMARREDDNPTIVEIWI